MSQQRSFRIIVSTPDLANSVGSETIKRDMINAFSWLHDYCKDPNLFQNENLYEVTINILKYFKDCLAEEGKNIHEFAGCRSPMINTYTTEVTFVPYDFGVDETYHDG